MIDIFITISKVVILFNDNSSGLEEKRAISNGSETQRIQ